jgi:hypothetical protein
MDKSGDGAGFLRELRFPLPIYIPSASPQSSSLSPEAAAVPVASQTRIKKKSCKQIAPPSLGKLPAPPPSPHGKNSGGARGNKARFIVTCFIYRLFKVCLNLTFQ